LSSESEQDSSESNSIQGSTDDDDAIDLDSDEENLDVVKPLPLEEGVAVVASKQKTKVVHECRN
jgi:hypothetical protein